jgi:hypothetical protein
MDIPHDKDSLLCTSILGCIIGKSGTETFHGGDCFSSFWVWQQRVDLSNGGSVYHKEGELAGLSSKFCCASNLKQETKQSKRSISAIYECPSGD